MTGRAVCGFAFAAAAVVVIMPGCRREGCVGGDDGRCVPVTACAALRTTCQNSTLSVGNIETPEQLLRIRNIAAPMNKTMVTVGDLVLENNRVRVVLDRPEHAQNLSPSGGTILDLAPLGVSNGDQVNAIFQAAGLLPRDAVHYDSAKTYDERSVQRVEDAYVAVVFRGHLEGDRRVTVVTRYELRPCEPGVRVSTDLYNGAPDANTLFLADGFFWGDNTLAPFAPGQGLGFRAPEIDLLHIDKAWREWPLLAARSQAPPYVSYAVTPCDRPRAAGFSSTTLTAVGVPLAPTLPGDGIHYERFIVAAEGPGISDAVGEALRVRSAVHGDPEPVTVTGRVVAKGVPIDGQSGRAASLLFYEPAIGVNPDDEARRTPWSEAVPSLDGKFRVTLPPGRSYRVQPYAFGRPGATPTSFAVADRDIDIGDITLTASARLIVKVQAPGQSAVEPVYAELVLIPVTPSADTSAPAFYGLFPGCDPMLGPPHAESPACNRAVTDNGSFDVLIPAGQYYAYVTRGPFSTLDRTPINAMPGSTVQVDSLVELLTGILPTGAVSGDFHVHGAASYDSAIPDKDRVASFLAADLDVVVATDHDVVSDYDAAIKRLDPRRGIAVIPGVEQTPNIPWFVVPGERFPKTLGHFNFWPLDPDATKPHNGVDWDELLEPGEMMDKVSDIFSVKDRMGVRQLNHPFSETKLGRDTGFLRAIGYNPCTPIKPGTSFAADVLLRAPGIGHHNNDWDVQEVMTGASRADWLRYRALWFSLLSQGILRAGTANSDSHSLALERVGYPRNIVLGAHVRADLKVDRFDADVRRGHMIGTNGPVLLVSIGDGSKAPFLPDIVDLITPSSAATLSIEVRAAPWIPVEEIRIFVNGKQVMTIPVWEDFKGADHLGSRILRSTPAPIPLSELLGDARDAWLLVEAGMKQETPPDIDDDGLPDLPEADVVGRPADVDDPRFDLEAVAPGVWPVAFSNPFIIDRDGDGWTAPGLNCPPSGSR